MNGTDDLPHRSPGARPTGAEAEAQATRPAPAAGDRPVTLDTAQLFDGRSEVRLLHRGQEYRLRVTRQGKLILTK